MSHRVRAENEDVKLVAECLVAASPNAVSVKEVAEYTNTTPSLAYYRLQKFCRGQLHVNGYAVQLAWRRTPHGHGREAEYRAVPVESSNGHSAPPTAALVLPPPPTTLPLDVMVSSLASPTSRRKTVEPASHEHLHCTVSPLPLGRSLLVLSDGRLFIGQEIHL